MSLPELVEIYFNKWRAYYTEHVDMRQKYEKAVSYHGNRVKIKVVSQWKLFTKESVRKTVSYVFKHMFYICIKEEIAVGQAKRIFYIFILNFLR